MPLVLSCLHCFPQIPGPWLFCLALPRGLPGPGLGRPAGGTNRPVADNLVSTFFPSLISGAVG